MVRAYLPIYKKKSWNGLVLQGEKYSNFELAPSSSINFVEPQYKITSPHNSTSNMIFLLFMPRLRVLNTIKNMLGTVIFLDVIP